MKRLLRQYNITFYCSTTAESPSEAILIAMQQVRHDQAAYVEIEELDLVYEETDE